jgi:hypothetical protein
LPGFSRGSHRRPSKLFVTGNTTATVNNIAAHEWLFRFGIVSDLVGAVILILLVLASYQLFKDVDQYLAVLVVILGGVMPAVIYFVNVVSDAGALMVVRGADFLSVFEKPQRDALVMLFLRLHDHQNTAAEILRGVWLFPLAILVYRSRFLPRFLGVWLAIGGLRLRDPEPYERTLTAISEQSVYHLPAPLLRGAGAHAVAHHQGRQAASAGRRSLIVGDCLGSTSWVVGHSEVIVGSALAGGHVGYTLP